MWVSWALVSAVFVIIAFVVVDRLVKARARDDLEQIDTWEHLDLDNRLLAHTQWARERTREFAVRDRNFWTGFVAIALGGALMFSGLRVATDDVVEQAEINQQQSVDACRQFRTLLRVLADNTDSLVRTRQRQRDRLADSLADPDRYRSIPGFGALGPGVRNFLEGLADAQQMQTSEEIAQVDAELGRLRAQEGILDEFARTLNCPG